MHLHQRTNFHERCVHNIIIKMVAGVWLPKFDCTFGILVHDKYKLLHDYDLQFNIPITGLEQCDFSSRSTKNQKQYPLTTTIPHKYFFYEVLLTATATPTRII